MPPLGDQELDLLRYITEQAPISVRDATANYGKERGLARTTILTMMERLRTKGYLLREQVKGIHQYRPCFSQAEVTRELVRTFVEKTLGGSPSPFMAYLAKDTQVSASELEELRQLVDALEKQEGKNK